MRARWPETAAHVLSQSSVMVWKVGTQGPWARDENRKQVVGFTIFRTLAGYAPFGARGNFINNINNLGRHARPRTERCVTGRNAEIVKRSSADSPFSNFRPTTPSPGHWLCGVHV